MREFDRALSLAPGPSWGCDRKSMDRRPLAGRLDPLKAELRLFPRGSGLGHLGDVVAQRAALLLWERNAEDLLEMIQTALVDDFESQTIFLPCSLYTAWAHQLRGDRGQAFKQTIALIR